MTTDISKLLNNFNQQHISKHLNLMTETERQALLNDIEQIDFGQIANLYESYRSGLKAEKKKKAARATPKDKPADTNTDKISFKNKIEPPEGCPQSDASNPNTKYCHDVCKELDECPVYQDAIE